MVNNAIERPASYYPPHRELWPNIYTSKKESHYTYLGWAHIIGLDLDLWHYRADGRHYEHFEYRGQAGFRTISRFDLYDYRHRDPKDSEAYARAVAMGLIGGSK